MQSPTGGDNILLPPIGQEVLSNAQATSVIKINDGTNSSATTMTTIMGLTITEKIEATENLA